MFSQSMCHFLLPRHCCDLQRNALDAMISEPNKTQDPMFVDDPTGNKQSVKGAGMVPNFVEKKVWLLLLYFIAPTEIVVLQDTKPLKCFRFRISDEFQTIWIVWRRRKRMSKNVGKMNKEKSLDKKSWCNCKRTRGPQFLRWAQVKVRRWLFSGHFWPPLTWATIFEPAWL